MLYSVNKNIIWFYIISIIFIGVNAFFLSNESYLINLIPLILLVVLFAFFALDKLIFITVFLTPLSVPLKEYIPGLGFDMQLPNEPIIVGVMLLFFLKILIEKKFDKKILEHPVSICILIYLFLLTPSIIT